MKACFCHWHNSFRMADMKIIYQIGRLIPAIALMCGLAACSDERTTTTSEMSSDTAVMSAPPMNNVAPDTTMSGMEGNMTTPAGNSVSGSDMSGNSGGSSTSSGGANTETRTANDKAAGTDMKIGPNATTVLSGEKDGKVPKGVKKGRDYIPRDSINNRTGLAPPR